MLADALVVTLASAGTFWHLDYFEKWIELGRTTTGTKKVRRSIYSTLYAISFGFPIIPNIWLGMKRHLNIQWVLLKEHGIPWIPTPASIASPERRGDSVNMVWVLLDVGALQRKSPKLSISKFWSKHASQYLQAPRTHIVFHPRSPKLSMTQRILGAWTEICSLPIQLVAAFTALFSQVASRPSGDRRHGRLTWKSEKLMHGLSKNQRLPQTISVSYWKLMNIGLSIGVNLWMLGARLFWTPVMFNDSMKPRTWT